MLAGAKRRIVAYVAVIAAVGAVIYSLRGTPVDVTLMVDFAGVRYSGSSPLTEAAIAVHASDGKWIGSSVQSYPAALFASGPPSAAQPFELKLERGEYDVRISLRYGDQERSGAVVTSRSLKVESAGRLDVDAATQ